MHYTLCILYVYIYTQRERVEIAGCGLCVCMCVCDLHSRDWSVSGSLLHMLIKTAGSIETERERESIEGFPFQSPKITSHDHMSVGTHLRYVTPKWKIKQDKTRQILFHSEV